MKLTGAPKIVVWAEKVRKDRLKRTDKNLQPESAASARPPVGPDQKDECLLHSINCPNETDSYLDRIRKLREEIAKGTAVYTPKELERLQAKLEETKGMLDVLLRP